VREHGEDKIIESKVTYISLFGWGIIEKKNKNKSIKKVSLIRVREECTQGISVQS
jgi:hypothetical protein